MKLKQLAILAVLALAACGDEGGSASAVKGAKTAAKPAAETAKPAAAVGELAYNYDPVGKRDPFRSPVQDLTQASDVGNSPCSEPLCQWDLDQLTLVAIVTGDANPIGMVEDPQGRGYIIRRNSKIGRRGGKVTQIMRGSVTVTELWQQTDGKVTPAPVTLALKTDKQTQPELDLSTGAPYQ